MSPTSDLKPVYLNLVPCHGCGACAEVAPDIFEMDPLTDQPIQLKSEASAETIRQAIAYCPNECISTDEE